MPYCSLSTHVTFTNLKPTFTFIAIKRVNDYWTKLKTKNSNNVFHICSTLSIRPTYLIIYLLKLKEIADAFSNYYGSSYNLNDDNETPQPTPELIEQFLTNIYLPKLQPADLQILNSPFSSSDILETISALPLNKSPGPDGYTSEYYKNYAEILYCKEFCIQLPPQPHCLPKCCKPQLLHCTNQGKSQTKHRTSDL